VRQEFSFRVRLPEPEPPRPEPARSEPPRVPPRP